MQIEPNGKALKLLDTVKVVKINEKGEITALKGRCKAGDLRREPRM